MPEVDRLAIPYSPYFLRTGRSPDSARDARLKRSRPTAGLAGLALANATHLDCRIRKKDTSLTDFAEGATASSRVLRLSPRVLRLR
jgi:hypothetical protein